MKTAEILLGGLIMIACVGAGAIGAGMFWQNVAPRPSSETTAVPKERRHKSSDEKELESRLSLLEARVRGLNPASAGVDDSLIANQLMEDETTLRENIEDPVEQTRRLADELSSHRERFESETNDLKWSSSATDSLRNSLLHIPDVDFDVEELDCHTTLCFGKLSWPEGADVLEEAKKVAEHPYETNCATSVYLDHSHQSADERTEARVVFDCSELRNGGI